MAEMKILGRHLVAEMHGCPTELLLDLEFARRVLREAVEASGATYLGEFHTVFEPGGGVSVIIAVAESHLSIHTWPEYGYAALDIFTCGDVADPWKAYEYVVSKYRPEKVNVTEMRRGLVEVAKEVE